MIHRFKKISFLFGLIVSLVGLTALLGWLMDITLLKSISPNWVSMKVNTALCFLLAGIVVILLNREKKESFTHIKRIFIIILSLVILLISTISFLQYLFNFNIFLDELFFKDEINEMGIYGSGRITPSASLCFMLLSLSFLSANKKIFNLYLFQLFSLLAGTIALIVFVGYLFESEKILSISSFTTMAFNTSVSFLLLMFSILLSRSSIGFMNFITSNSTSARFFRILFSLTIFFIIATGWVHYKIEQAGIFQGHYGDVFFLIFLIFIATFILWKLSISLSKSEEALKLSEIKFREFFENSQVGMYRTKLDGSAFIDVNQKFTDIVGFSQEELFNTPSKTLWVNQEERDKMIKHLKEHNGILVDYEVKILSKNEAIKDVLVSVILNTEKMYLEGAMVDISERKKTEIKLKETVEKLENSNHQLEQFAYVASHDLQEPLRMISSYTQLLEKRYKDKLDQDALDFIHFAVDGATRMQKLLNDLLDFSRISTRGKNFEEIDTNVILGIAISNLQQLIIDNTALISIDDLPKLSGDGTQILRVFQNLIENAIKFKKKTESPKIHISCKEKIFFYEFSVKDNGIGIDSQYQDKVFTIFQRLHSIKDYPGTGIGLAICKQIIEKHGGKIWFESKENEGTTFYFTLNKQGETDDA